MGCPLGGNRRKCAHQSDRRTARLGRCDCGDGEAAQGTVAAKISGRTGGETVRLPFHFRRLRIYGHKFDRAFARESAGTFSDRIKINNQVTKEQRSGGLIRHLGSVAVSQTSRSTSECRVVLNHSHKPLVAKRLRLVSATQPRSGRIKTLTTKLRLGLASLLCFFVAKI